LAPGRYYLRLELSSSTPCYITVEDTLDIADYVQVDIPSDTALCSGDSLVLISNTSGGTSPHTYEWWDLQDSISLGISLPDYHAVPSKSGRIALVVKEASGCKHSDSMNFVVHALPVINLGNDLAYCSGDSLFFDAGGDSARWNYTWNTGDTIKAIWTSQLGVLQLDISDSNGCKSKDALTVYENKPQIIGASNATVCVGDSVFLYVQGSDEFFWYDAVNYTGTPQDIPLYTGAYQSFPLFKDIDMLIYGNRNWLGSSCAVSQTIKLSTWALPSVSLGADRRICAGDSVLVEASGSSGLSYDWNTGSQTNQIWVKDAGTYSVSITDSNGCKNGTIILGQGSGSVDVRWNNPGRGILSAKGVHAYGCENAISKQVNIWPTSVQSPNKAGFQVYPNPGNGEFTLQLEEYHGEQAYELINSLGQVVHTGVLETQSNSLNLEHLKSGVYILRVTNVGEIRLVIVKG